MNRDEAKTAIPEGRYVEVTGGVRLHCLEQGEGPAVVFLHGSGPGASGYSNFRRNYTVFADEGFRAVVPDMVGFGLSDKPSGRDYTLDFFCETVKGLLDRIGVDQAVLVGNSLGGAVAIKLALDDPSLVERLVLMAPGGIEELSTYMAMPGIASMMSGFVDGTLDRHALGRLLALLVYDESHVSEELITERFLVKETQPRDVLARMHVPNMEARLGELSCPVLCFWGIEDQFCPASGSEKIVRACRNARAVLLSECGHWVMVEHSELFNRLSIDFLLRG